MNDTTNGSTKEFDINWREREEAFYNHWTRGTPENQIQLAFRMHWEVFNEIMGEASRKKGKCLEVGCGRGSLSSYFADNGWDVILLDSSLSVLNVAKQIFKRNRHKAAFVKGDANILSFPDNTFDVTFSIGLLEHFENVVRPISEQLRVLKPGGWFFGYIVPEKPHNIQRYFRWFNDLLGVLSRLFSSGKAKARSKEPVFRSTFDSHYYLTAIKPLRVDNISVEGMYPLPMISYSPEFPFTLMSPPMEFLLTRVFQVVLYVRRLISGKHGWFCSEKMGQAFLLAFQKPAI
jgi:ubiquinone/menaquinone biosynthesis C-methylase UbiE